MPKKKKMTKKAPPTPVECPECGERVTNARDHVCYGGFGDPADGPSEQEILGDVGDR